MKPVALLMKLFKYGVLALLVGLFVALAWLRWDANRPRDEWWVERQGQLIETHSERSTTGFGQLTEAVTLTSDSGLRVSIRLIRNELTDGPRTVLLVLGGHRTGRDAVDLFGDTGEWAVVAVDYPYDGPEKVRGFRQTIAMLPKARKALRDTAAALSLVLDWLVEQDWVDDDRIIGVGGSLGVPPIAATAARDSRITGVMLVHGAADNRLWLETQVARRVDTALLHYPLSVLLDWLSYGPVYDAGDHVGLIAPRPVLIVGARDDERTPAGQAQLLFELAADPRRLRFTDGEHIEPDRTEIIAALLAIAREEEAFLSGTAN